MPRKNGKTKSKMQGTPMAQSQNWVFTFFAKGKYLLDDCTDKLFVMTEIDKTSICSVAMACETCPKTGREHLQGYIQCFAKRMSRLAKRAEEVPVQYYPAPLLAS